MNTPNKITFSRIFLVFGLYLGLFIFGFFNVAVPSYGPENAPINLVYLIVFVIFVIAASTDTLDGYLARKNNQITDLGKFLDPIADKMLVNATLIYLAVPQYFSQNLNQIQISLYVVIIFIVRDLVVDTVRLMAAKKNIVLAANIYGKLKTIFQMIALPIILLNGYPFSYFDYNFPKGLRIADFFVYLALFFSVLSGIIYVVQNKKVFLSESKEVDLKKIDELFKLCEEKHLTFGSVESFTGGLFASSITSVPGSSKYFLGTIVSYNPLIKEEIVGVSEETIDKYSVVSKEVATEMVINGTIKLHSDICVSFTGNAGPSVDKGNKPVGLIFIGIKYKDKIEVLEYTLKGERNDIRKEACNIAIEKIIEIISK